MKEGPSFEKIVGNIQEETKEKLINMGKETFNNQAFEELKGLEREKTLEEQAIISLANKKTNRIREKYGLDDFDISEKNFHIVKEKKWPREKDTAFYNQEYQSVVMEETLSNARFMTMVFHEMLHFKSYNARQTIDQDDGSKNVYAYRIGLEVFSRDGKHLRFRNLDEAVIEKMTKKYTSEIFKYPPFKRLKEEMEQTKQLRKKGGYATTKDGKPLFDEDTFYAEVNKEKNIQVNEFSYKEERVILNNLIDKIFDRNSDRFKKREEVFEVFEKAMMTGNIFPLGKLIDGTFSKGTFRKLGDFNNEDELEKMKDFVNSL